MSLQYCLVLWYFLCENFTKIFSYSSTSDILDKLYGKVRYKQQFICYCTCLRCLAPSTVTKVIFLSNRSRYVVFSQLGIPYQILFINSSWPIALVINSLPGWIRQIISLSFCVCFWCSHWQVYVFARG